MTAYPGRVRAHFQGNAASSHRPEGLIEPLSGCRTTPFQHYFTPLVQNAVAAASVSQIESDRERLTSSFFARQRFLLSATLLHGRSPLDCTSSACLIGSVTHPAEGPAFASHLTNLLIAHQQRPIQAGNNQEKPSENFLLPPSSRSSDPLGVQVIEMQALFVEHEQSDCRAEVSAKADPAFTGGGAGETGCEW